MSEKMTVWLLDLGTLYAKRESIVCRGRPEDVSRMHLPVMGGLVRHPKGFLLYDTGCRPDAMEEGWPPNMQKARPSRQYPASWRYAAYPPARLIRWFCPICTWTTEETSPFSHTPDVLSRQRTWRWPGPWWGRRTRPAGAGISGRT